MGVMRFINSLFCECCLAETQKNVCALRLVAKYTPNHEFSPLSCQIDVLMSGQTLFIVKSITDFLQKFL